MTADQVVAITGADTQREALRQRSVASILDAQGLESEIALRESSGALNREQAARIRRLAQFDVEQARAQLALTQSGTEENRAQTERLRTLLPEEVAAQRANVRQSDAAASASRTSASVAAARNAREEALFPYTRDEARLNATPYTIPDPLRPGQTVDIPRGQVGSFITGTTGQITAAQDRRDRFIAQAENYRAAREKDAASRLKDAKEAELNFLNPPKGVDDIGASTYADTFNANSDDPYLYLNIPDERNAFARTFTDAPKYVGKVPIPIPRVDSQRFPNIPQTASEVYAAATTRGKTVRQYLEQDFYPALGQRAPWLQR